MKGHFTTISGHFFVNHMVIFHKTESQTVILRCLMSLNLNWYRSYDTKCKNAKNGSVFLYKIAKKNGNGNIFSQCIHSVSEHKKLRGFSNSTGLFLKFPIFFIPNGFLALQGRFLNFLKIFTLVS